ncbi:MAG: YdcF family protein [Oscillospiraceae bacterium]|nr:YdcF family protein [Oscillospiraceae bacterium]
MKQIKTHRLLLWLVLTVLFFLTAHLIACRLGQDTTVDLHIGTGYSADEIAFSLSEPVAACTNPRVEQDMFKVDLHALKAGKAYAEVTLPNGDAALETVYVHKNGVIALNTYLGRSRGSSSYLIAAFLSIALALVLAIHAYRAARNACMYQYACAGLFGLILFLSFTLLDFLLVVTGDRSPEQVLMFLLNSCSMFAGVLLPVAFLMSLFVTANNVILLKREGFTWRNMLGTILGGFLCCASLTPMVLYRIAESVNFSEMHRETSAARYTMMFAESVIYGCLAYLECILLGVIVLGIASARHIPAFNKDHILILGCKVGADGKPTKLLQSRIDRAIEFAEMQKQATGKELTFVPSGGKGADEVIAEAVCIKNYLLEQGIPESRILTEDRSETTAQNLRYSYELISADKPDAEIAFSTTNYHVFRAGALAYAQGHRFEGIGAKTKQYFWLNAFVREFIAVIYETKRLHITLLAYIVTVIAAVTLILYHAAQF